MQRRKLKATILLCLIFVWISVTYVRASEVDESYIEITPSENQYLELRATQVKDIAGQNKQVIMELWGNNVEFKRI